MGGSKVDWWKDSEGSLSPEKQDAMHNPVLKNVIKTLARKMLKKAVPKNVFFDCADAINKAFCPSGDRLENHKRNMQRINSRKLLSPNMTLHQMQAN